MVSNKVIQKRMGEIDRGIANANSEKDLLDLLDKVIAYNHPLKYNNTAQLVAGSGFLIASAMYFLYKYKFSYSVTGIDYIISGSAVLVGLIFFIYAWSRNNSVSSLSDEIFNKDLLFDNNIRPKNVNGKDYAEQLKGSLCEFNRGNYSREIEFLAEGNYAGNEHSLNFNYYCFHYVDQRLEVVVTPNGKGGTTTSTRTVYDHYRRYGILLDFEFASSLIICSNSPGVKYKDAFSPASLVFRKNYSVSCNDQLKAAKFLKPATVLKFEEVATDFNHVNFEVNANGAACISVEDNLLDVQHKYGLDEPSLFRQEIAQNNELKKLNTLLDFAHYLMKQSDNNFKK